MGVVPWSPLAFGLLSGKYDRAVVEAAAPRADGLPNGAGQSGTSRPADDKRLDGANPFGDSLFTEKNWQIVDALKAAAKDAGKSPAQLALAWVLGRPGVASTLIGASKVAQVADNVAALSVVLSAEHRAALDTISATPARMLYSLFTPAMRQQVVFGGSAVVPWRP